MKIVVVLMAVGLSGCTAASTGRSTDVISRPTAAVGSKAIPVIASSEIVVGANRFLVGLLNRNGAPIGTPHTRMRIEFFDPKKSDSAPVSAISTRFIWGLKPAIGFYEGEVHFSHEGTWQAAFTLSGGGLDQTTRQKFSVVTQGTTPAVGSSVPASDSPTGSGKALDLITTDPHPDPNFYSTSIADAVGAQKPFVVIFATPKYCASELCGPMLEVAKRVSNRFPKLTFIQVEIYRLPKDGHLPSTPSTLPLSAPVKQWGLQSDPWAFVVDAHGGVSAKFEGTVTAGELIKAIDQAGG